MWSQCRNTPIFCASIDRTKRYCRWPFPKTEGMLELKVFKDTGLSAAVEAYAQQHATNPAFTPEKLC